MTMIIENQTFGGIHDRGGNTFIDYEFRQCQFTGSSISVTKDPSNRSIARKVILRNCQATGCAIETAIIEETLVENLITHNMLACWATVFKHVTLRGRMGKIMFSNAVATGTASLEEQRAFDQANSVYYASVDWALDITEAEFFEADIRNIPARLIRRDPETQAVVTREKAAQGKWKHLDLSKTWWPVSIRFFLEDRPNDMDVVLVAPKRHRKYKLLLDGIKRLRDAGVAEPD